MSDLVSFLTSEFKNPRASATFFVGAGISKPSPSNVPTSNEIIENLTAALCIDPDAEIYKQNLSKRILQAGMKLENLFEIIETIVSSKLTELFSIFKGGSPNFYHYFLSRLLETNLVKYVVTTNFDQLIEQASVKGFTVFAAEPEFKNRANRSVFKIHGTVDRPETMIAVLPQVSHGLGPNKNQLLKEALENTCIVIGWSNDDIDLTPSFLETVGAGTLIWLCFNPNLVRIVDFSETKSLENTPEISPKIRKILEKRKGILAVCNPEVLLRELWQQLDSDLDPIPHIETKNPAKVISNKPKKDESLSLTKPLLPSQTLDEFEKGLQTEFGFVNGWYISEPQTGDLKLDLHNWSRSLSSANRFCIIGDILRQLDSYEEAIGLFQKAEPQIADPSGLFSVHYREFNCAAKLNHAQDAFHYFQSALQDKGYKLTLEEFLKSCPRDPELVVLYGNLGIYLEEIGRIQDAAKCYQQDVILCASYRLPGISQATVQWAKGLYLLGEYGAAKRTAEIAITLGREEGNIGVIRHGHQILATITSIEGNWAEAKTHIENSLDIAELVGQPKNRVIALNNFAKHLCDIEELDASLKYAYEALKIGELYKFNDTQADSWMIIGVILKEKALQSDSIQLREDFFEKSLEANTHGLKLIESDQSNDSRSKSMILNNRGLLYAFLKEYAKAQDCFSESLSLRTSLLDEIGQATILNNIALTILREGEKDPKLAEAKLQSALAIYEKFGCKSGQVQVLNDLGGVYVCTLLKYRNFKGKCKEDLINVQREARKYFEDSLSIAKELGLQSRIRQAEDNLKRLEPLKENTSMDDLFGKAEHALSWYKEAIFKQRIGDYEEARHLLERSIEVFREVKFDEALAAALSQLSQVCMFEEDLAKALDCIRESVAIRETLKDYSHLAGDYQQMGNIAMKVGQYQFAHDNYQESLRLAKALKNDSGVASAESCLGILDFYQNNFSSARTHLERSQEIRMKLGDKLGIGKNLNHLGGVAEKEKKFKEAAKLYNESYEILHKIGVPEAKTALENYERVKNIS